MAMLLSVCRVLRGGVETDPCFSGLHDSRLHEDCAASATASIAKHAAGANGDRRLSELDQATVRRIGAPLLRLRQACSHPSLAKGNSLMAAVSGGGKVRTTMASVAGSLVDKAKINCTNAFQALVLAQVRALPSSFCATVCVPLPYTPDTRRRR